MSLKDLWTNITQKKSLNDQELCAIIFRNIRHRCNTFVFDNIFASPKQVLIATTTKLDTFQTSSMRGESGSLQQNHKATTKRLRKPKEPHVKVNWDANLNLSTNSTGLGGIIGTQTEMLLLRSVSLRTTEPMEFLYLFFLP